MVTFPKWPSEEEAGQVAFEVTYEPEVSVCSVLLTGYTLLRKAEQAREPHAASCRCEDSPATMPQCCSAGMHQGH